MTLNKKVLRSAKKKISFHVVTAFLTAITVAMLIGAYVTAETIESRSEEIYGTLHVEEAQFTTDTVLSESDIAEYEKAYDLVLEPQYYTDVESEHGTIRVFRENEKLNLAWIYETADGRKEKVQADHPRDGEIYLCKKYASANTLEIGETLQTGAIQTKVSGYVLRPDYLNTIKEFTETIGDYSKFTIAVLSTKTYDEAFGASAPTYYSVIYHSAEKINSFRKALYEAYHPMDYFNADANSRISLIRSEVPMLKNEFSSYSIILFALVGVLIAFMLSRILHGEARNVGTLKALGYRTGELAVHYTLYALLPTVAGGVLGVLVSIPFSKAFSAFFFQDLDDFPYKVQYSVPVMLGAAVLPIVANAIVSALVTSKLLKKDAVLLLKKESSARQATRVLRKAEGLRFRTIYMIRVILGNPVRTLVFLCGMTIASVIILLGGMCQDSQRNIVEHILPEMMGAAKYETGLKTFHTGTVENGQTLIDVMFEIPNQKVAFNLIGYDEDNTLLKRETISGNPVSYGGYYLTSAAANYYGIKAGDTFSFVHRITGEETMVEISDIIYNNALMLLITSKENAARLVGVSPEAYNNILSEVPVNVNGEDIYKIADFAAYKDSFEQTLAVTKVVYAILLTVGILVCVLIVNLLSGMLIDENARNISMLKVLGYREREIRDVILRPHHFLVPCCYLLAIPLTAYMTRLMFADSVANFGVWIDVVVKPSTVFLYFLIVTGSYLLSLLLAKRKLGRVDMAESLKQED